MTFKLLSWNVNGLRALLRKGGWDWVARQSFDVISCQEIRVTPPQLKGVQKTFHQPYTPHWYPAEKLGYSGVGSFSKIHPNWVEKGIGNETYDREGRVLVCGFEAFTLVNVYVPSGSRDDRRLEYKLNFLEELINFCQNLEKRAGPLIICGDINIAHNEIDLHNHQQNRSSSGFLPEERTWMDAMHASGFQDSFRALHPEAVKYTWWAQWSDARSRNVGWRLDYFLVSKSLRERVVEAVVHDDVMGSDHCPVSLTLEI